MGNRFTKGRGLLGSLKIGSGNAIFKAVNYGTLSAVYGTILPGQIGTVAAAMSGLAVGDVVSANFGTIAPPNGLGLAGQAPGAGTVRLFFVNATTGTLAPGTVPVTYAHFDLT